MISTPFSLTLGKDEPAAAAVPGTTVTVEPGRMKLFLGAGADPAKMVSCTSSLRNCFNLMKNSYTFDGSDAVASGRWDNAVSGNITIASDTAAVGDDDVAVVIAGDFSGSHFRRATFGQLINALIEQTQGN